MSVLETNRVSKQYPGTLALDEVSVSFEGGKIHALVGKNGSGKSTLVNIFSGAVPASGGTVLLNGSPISFKNPAEAQQNGIATVYQELSLVPGLTVAENILIGRMPMKGPMVDWKKTRKIAQELLEELGIDISPNDVVSDLTVWQCQMVEIAKAMSFDPKVLQLDEPTSSLAQNEVESLFRIIRKLREKDVIVLYITHKLQELWQIADTCTVLRDGKLIGTEQISELSRRQLIGMMFGDVEVKTRPEDLRYGEDVVLKVEHLSDGHRFTDVSFELHKGEVLGIAGMLGSGRTELLNCIFGAQKAAGGAIWLHGEEIKDPNPEMMNRKGVAMTQEDRKRLGVNLDARISDNLCYASLQRLGKGIMVDRAKEKQYVARQVADLGIKVADVNYLVSSLSGGNQQKVVVGNWLNIEPTVMLFDEPSRGIDVNAKQQIFQIIWDQARKGISSIMVSSELEELIEVCHRILILRNGVIERTVLPQDVSIEDLYAISMGE
ncbi:sugar ABC transporter ATP-binding protein [Ruminococcaceae bacterium OttesenSCG-928-D13]|nr:sugar ABC transporter ATP-binding protein [Ruminococcaceae bacterium OttesenSCG-928-D13]